MGDLCCRTQTGGVSLRVDCEQDSILWVNVIRLTYVCKHFWAFANMQSPEHRTYTFACMLNCKTQELLALIFTQYVPMSVHIRICYGDCAALGN